MDLAVGKVLNKLDELHLKENTLIIFTSDNGGLSTSEGWPTSNLPLRAGKGWLYEGGIRTPFIVRWPAAVKSGQVIETPVSSPDLFPTLLAASQAAPEPGQTLDGINLLHLLRGEPGTERALYWHYPHYGNQGGAPGAAIRRGPLKLIHWYEDQRNELFHLSSDPGEQHDRSAEEPELAAALFAELRQWQERVGAKMPVSNPDFDAQQPNGRAATRPRANAAR